MIESDRRGSHLDLMYGKAALEHGMSLIFATVACHALQVLSSHMYVMVMAMGNKQPVTYLIGLNRNRDHGPQSHHPRLVGAGGATMPRS